jgi:hypothetical protein
MAGDRATKWLVLLDLHPLDQLPLGKVREMRS